MLSKLLCHYEGIMKLGPGTSRACNALIAFQTATWLCGSRPSLLLPGRLYLLVTVPSYSGLVSSCSLWRSLDEHVRRTMEVYFHRRRICLICIFMFFYNTWIYTDCCVIVNVALNKSTSLLTILRNNVRRFWQFQRLETRRRLWNFEDFFIYSNHLKNTWFMIPHN